MARYTGPSCKICRREGTKLFLKGNRCTTKCTLDTKHGSKAPGQHGATSKKQKEYGIHLREKQKVRRYYGVLEGSSSITLTKRPAQGNHRQNLLITLERRSTTWFTGGLGTSATRRARWCCTVIYAQRQKADIPSILLRAGDGCRSTRNSELKNSLAPKNCR